MLGENNRLLEDFECYTWGEFVTWLKGRQDGEYGVTARLLRVIAYQMVTLHPYIDKVDKPYTIEEYMRFPTDEAKEKKIEYIDPKELAKIWKLGDYT